MESIIRDPTKDELGRGPDSEHGIDIPLVTGKGKFVSPKDKFIQRLAEEEQKATKLGLPFASAAARADVEDINRDLTNQLKRQGYINKDYKLTGIDWSKYSDLKNFEVLEEGTQHDPGLSSRHRLPIYIKLVKYKYKGFSNTYTVMESSDVAVKRAQLELEEAAAKRLQAVLKEDRKGK